MARRCCSNWLVTEPSWVQCPVLCGRMASSLIRKPAPTPGVSKSSTAMTPVTPSSLAIRSAAFSAAAATSSGDVQGGGDDFVAHPVHLDGVHHRPGPCFTVRGPRDHGRELAAELHLGLGQQRGHGLEPVGGGRGVRGRGRRSARPCRRSRRGASSGPPASRSRSPKATRSVDIGDGGPRAGSAAPAGRSRRASPACPGR